MKATFITMLLMAGIFLGAQEPVQITFDPANDWDPNWSPDGNFMCFTSNRTGSQDIWKMTANGDNQERLTYTDLHAIQPNWQPDISSWIDDQNKSGTSIKSGSLKVFPNPSNSFVTIQYSLLSSNHIKLKIINSAGKLIKTLVNNKQTEGSYEIIWDDMDNSGNVVLAGIYLLIAIIHIESYVPKLIKY